MRYNAVLTGMDTHPANSLAIMLRSMGYKILMLNDLAIRNLQKRGYTGGVLREMLDEMGYDQPKVDDWVDERALEYCDLFVDLKTDDINSMIDLYPNLKKKSVHFLINGGRDDYENCGFEYPVITANQWVKGQAFVCYLPFDNIHEIEPRLMFDSYRQMELPMGLLHNAWNWGFQAIMPGVIKETGLLVYGHYHSPAGMLPNRDIKRKLQKTICFIHLKANDCPGYAIYEAFAAGVPVLATQLMVERMKYDELFVDGQTCLLWGKTSYKIEENKVVEFIEQEKETMVQEIADFTKQLRDPGMNRQIGYGGYLKWKELTEWTLEKREKLRQFFRANNLTCD